MMKHGCFSAFAAGWMAQLFLTQVTTGHPYVAIVSLVFLAANLFLWWDLSRDELDARRDSQ